MRLKEIVSQSLEQGRVRDEQGVWSRAHFSEQIQCLRRLGLREQEAFGLRVSQSREFLLWYLAGIELNLVIVPLSSQHPVNESREIWKQLGCRAAIIDGSFETLNENVISWPESIRFIFHSSGSTGIPKAIPIEESAVIRNAKDVMRHFSDSEAGHLGALNYAYTGGIYNSFLLGLITGGHIVVSPVLSGLQSRKVIQLVQQFQPHYVWLSPLMIEMLLKLNQPDLFKKSTALISCTAPLHQSLCQKAEEVWQLPVLQSYGLTETLIVSIEEKTRNCRTEFSAGSFISGPQSVQFSEEGLLTIRNAAVTPGYVRVETGRFLFSGVKVAGVFETQDRGRLDSNSYLHILGRTSNVLILNGLKIGAEEIEDFLFEKIQCAVAAVDDSDAQGNSCLRLVVEGRPSLSEEGISSKLVERFGPFVRPGRFEFVESLPRNANGKLDRHRLKESTSMPV